MSLSWTASNVGRARSVQVARNALTGIGARFAMMAVGFALTPYIVHHLGLRLFGLWSLTSSVAAYLGLLDFGLAGVFVKFITEYVESERRDLARQVVTIGALFYVVFGIVLALPVVCLAPLLVRSLHLPSSETQTAVRAFDALALLMVLSLIAGLPGSIVVGMQRMEVVSRNVVVAYLASAVATVVLLRAGWGITGVVVAGYAQLAVAAGLQYRSARRTFGPVWHDPRCLDRAMLGRMLSFGGWTQMTQILTVVGQDVGRFIAAATVGVVSVTFYELGSRLAYLSRSLPNYFLDAMMPVAAAADVREERAELERMYLSGTLYTMFGAWGIAGFLVGAGDLLVRVWMGVAYPAVSVVIAGLSVGYAFSSITGVGMTVLRASGRPKYEAYSMGVTAAVNLGLTALLAPRFGLAGIVAGAAAGWLAGAVFFTAVYHRLESTRLWWPVGRPLLALCGGAVVAGGAVWILSHAAMHQFFFQGRLEGAVMLLCLGLLYTLLFVGVSVAWGVWRSDPSCLLPRLLRRGRLIASGAFAR